MERFTEFSREAKTIFFEAILTGDLETVLMFLEAGIDPNIKSVNGWAPLTLAVFRDQLEIAHLLLDVGAKPSDEISFGDLFLAEYRGNKEMTRLLRRYGA